VEVVGSGICERVRDGRAAEEEGGGVEEEGWLVGGVFVRVDC
jgi:hypothetical protein